MTVTVKLNESDVAIFTFINKACACPIFGARHEITDKMEEAAYKTKRGYPVFKCVCGLKLAAFHCCISRSYVLEPYLTKRQHDKIWQEIGKQLERSKQ